METAVKVLAWQHGVILVFLAMLKTNLRQFKDGYRRQSIKINGWQFLKICLNTWVAMPISKNNGKTRKKRGIFGEIIIIIICNVQK